MRRCRHSSTAPPESLQAPQSPQAAEVPELPRSSETGSEVVAHILVQALIVMVVLALMQIAFALHTRNLAISAAGEGARRAALAGATADDGRSRTQQLLDQTIGMARGYDVSVSRIQRGGHAMVEVRVTTALPILLTWGPAGSLSVTGHALMEHDDE